MSFIDKVAMNSSRQSPQKGGRSDSTSETEEEVYNNLSLLGEEGLDDANTEEKFAEQNKETGSNDDGRGNSNSPVSDQLEVFRQQWQDELQQRPSSRSQSPHTNDNQSSKASNCNKIKQDVDIENEARAFFFQGMQAEDDGMLSEAIYYYRKALQLVPDIESKLGNVFNRSPRDRERQDSESSIEGSEVEEDLLANFEQLKLKDESLCQPEYQQRMTHISCLPVELIIYILQWVVSTDLDFRSLEMFSLVCRGFYMCARDERLWNKACEKVWGVNIGSTKKYGGSWRRMMIERPHLLFDGCYICKVTYVRQGEKSMDGFYQPFHLVEYFRFVRFFPDGQVLMLVSPDDPLQSLPKLKYLNSRAAGILKGGYRLSDSMVTCVLKRVKSETSNFRYKRQRQAANQDSETSYVVEFDVVSKGRKLNAQLTWRSYVVRTIQKATGEEVNSNFELNRNNFPPLIFSRVKSYTAASTEPLV